VQNQHIARPKIQELAAATSGTGITAGFSDILASSDSILEQKGGSLDIYREVGRDDQVKSTFQQRRLAITSLEWDITPGGESAQDQAAADFLRENIGEIEFDRITDRMLYSVFYGYAVGECMWKLDGNRVKLDDVKVRDRIRFRFSRKDHGLYLVNGPAQYERMPDNKFWTINTGADHDDEPYGLGLAHFLYWPVFFKRNGIKLWLIFLEKFGMPTVKGTASKSITDDKLERAKLLAALRAVQTDGAVIIPDGVEVELLEAARSGADTYSSLQERMDAAIAKIVLSQTMTTDNGSSRSQAEVHSGVRDEVVKADADLICASFNRTVATWLTEWNFPGAKPPKVWRKTEKPKDDNSLAERDSKIYALGFEPTEEYIEETYGPGWIKRENSGPAFDTPAQFAEFAGLTTLAARKAGHRQDQSDLIAASVAFASKYQDVMGERVNELLAYAEDTGDFETFGRKLQELIAEPPPESALQKAKNAGMFARLMGSLRGQR